MRRVYAKLTQEQIEAIVRLAEKERREPADQLALLVAPAIDRLIQKQAVPTRQEATA